MEGSLSLLTYPTWNLTFLDTMYSNCAAQQVELLNLLKIYTHKMILNQLVSISMYMKHNQFVVIYGKKWQGEQREL